MSIGGIKSGGHFVEKVSQPIKLGNGKQDKSPHVNNFLDTEKIDGSVGDGIDPYERDEVAYTVDLVLRNFLMSEGNLGPNTLLGMKDQKRKDT